MRVNILCVQETKWKGQKTKEVEDTGFKLWYTGATSGRNGVGILIARSLKDGVVEAVLDSSWRFGSECDQCLCPSGRS